MTEYDYSPEALEAHMRGQARIVQWSSANARTQLYHPDTPPTPAIKSRSLPRSKSQGPLNAQYNGGPSPPGAVDTQAAWEQKKRIAMSKVQGDIPQDQVYQYLATKTPYGTQLNITTQTSNGRYVQQRSYQQTTRPVVPQTLEVPPVNYAPLAQNPYPSSDHYQLQGAPLVPNRRVRSKSSHGPRTTEGGMYTAPPVPPMPPLPERERGRTHSSARPSGAAPPFNPSNGAFANGIYASPHPHPHPQTPPRTVHSQASVSTLQLPSAYLPASQQQLYAQQEMGAPRKSKSSATLKTRYAQEAHQPRIEDMPPMPVPQQGQVGSFYQMSRASKSSATLYAEPRANPGTPKDGSSAYSSPSKHSASTSKRSRRPREPMPEFGERMSTPHPAASQMIFHSLVPVATYREHSVLVDTPRPSLFKRMMGKK
ncbi:hypothetical protein C8R43DRAFT_1197689 [Mycena crocata]|nr:hypothetical protein C8R43DRAFT_1197689 [Mycena crocata]